jgi:hypothetical protein
MRKKLFMTLAAFWFFTIAGTALASSIYIDTFSGNDNYFAYDGNPLDLQDLEDDVALWYNSQNFGSDWSTDWDLEFYAKADAPYLSTTEGPGNLGLTYTTNKSGSWATGETINVFSVKAGNQYALYWLEDAVQYGSWDTYDLFVGNGNNTPAISHFSAWKIVGSTPPGPNPVPEPGTMAMLGIGLIGIAAGMRRKRHSS